MMSDWWSSLVLYLAAESGGGWKRCIWVRERWGRPALPSEAMAAAMAAAEAGILTSSRASHLPLPLTMVGAKWRKN